MAKVSLKALATISRETWLPSKSIHSSVWHYSIPNFDTGLAKLESTSSIMSNKFLITEPCVLISKLNPKTPRVWLIEKVQGEISVCSTEFIVLTPNSQDDLRFLYFLLKSNEVKQRLSEIATGTSNSHQRVRPEDILSLEVECVESIFERQKCSKILMSLESHISLNIEMSKTLEEIAQTIFKSWFIDFDPVKAKLAGEKPVGMDDATAALFPDSMDDSEVGIIPASWSKSPMGEFVQARRGKVITKSKTCEGPIPVIAGGLEPAYFHNVANVSWPVVTVSASGANAGHVRLNLEDIWASDCSYISKSETEYVYLCYLFLKVQQEIIFGMQQGGGQPHIYPSDLSRLPFPIPGNLRVLERFEELIAVLFEKVRNLEIQTNTLRAIRDSLLSRLISGEIQIPEEMSVS
jgi:type I restriction enzyme S subunit